MDIEGAEYDWILNINKELLKNIKQIVIEYHGLCNDKYSSKFNCNTSYEKKIKCLEKLNDTHCIIHAHGNNWSTVKNNIPNVLEITYLNKNYLSKILGKNKINLPIEFLDFPNNIRKPDINLNNYPFVSK